VADLEGKLIGRAAVTAAGEQDRQARDPLIRQVFAETRAARIFSKTLVETLCAMTDRPWPEAHRGKPITENWLARRLHGFEVNSRTLRIGDDRAKGYEAADFKEAFERYLPSGAIET
jgi:putative DNA primase/helicase